MAAPLQLSKIHLESFKNLEIPEAGLPFQNLNVWIGPNGSGKSNIIRVLRFLRDALAEGGVESRGVSRFDRAVMKLGRRRILAGSEKPPAEVRIVMPGTRKIRAISSGRLRLGIEWCMKDVFEPFYLSDMADGAVRMLLWAVILLSWELPSLLVLDVPETGLHPAWMKTLSELIKMTAENTQVIVITHNPDLLDGFTDQWQNVVSFNYDGPGRFVPKRLKDTLLLPKMAEGWELGDLYRVGDPAVEGWPW